MIQKEINEIRRRLAPDKNNIGKIYGCFVNTSGKIIAKFEEPFGIMPELETEKYMGILRRTLSGGIGRNLIDIPFSIAQVSGSKEHQLLSDLRRCELKDEYFRDAIYDKIITSTPLTDTNYLILLAYDSYDVPRKNKSDDGDTSDTVFNYIICAVCPVKDGKSELGYYSGKNEFHGYAPEQIVTSPVYGFMFPAFDGRGTNIYNALFYTKGTDILPGQLLKNLFNTDIPMSAAEQNATFKSVLAESLEEECRFDVIQNIHEQIRERMDAHKESKNPETLELSANEVSDILKSSGVSLEKAQEFRTKCEKEFGGGDSLNPTNIIDSKKFELITPQVKITVAPEYSCMIETRVIDGKKYILIPAGEGVEVNGMNINIDNGD